MNTVKLFTAEEHEVLVKARNILLLANMSGEVTPGSEEFMAIGSAYHKIAEVAGYPDED